MCGIVACVSNQCAILLLEGLSQLKNRGYDSVGIATLTDQKVRVDKFASQDAYGQLQSRIHDHSWSTWESLIRVGRHMEKKTSSTLIHI
jgi:glucosamine 6-phosphate synthetase-like amidotransferase/phosphosugar isomerase protein